MILFDFNTCECFVDIEVFGKFFEKISRPEEGERFDVLLQHRNLVIERIVSSSQVEPKVYTQEQDEWVLLLEGAATLSVEGEEIELEKGDYLFLPAMTPHEVEKVSNNALWLAIHLHP